VRRSAHEGRDEFSCAEAAEIRRLLALVRRAEPGSQQKLLRDKLRAIGFYISDHAASSAGFTRSDFDGLVSSGRVVVAGQPIAAVRRTPQNNARSITLGKPHGARTDGQAVESGAASLDVPDVVREAAAALAAEPMTLKTAIAGGVQDRPGLYALYGSGVVWKQLGLGEPPDRRPLYVGKAEASLVARDLNTHFATGETGRSSPRRSFAALLVREGALQLVAMPRRPHDPEAKKWDCFSLEHDGDERLTSWMFSRLRIAAWPKSADVALVTIEGAVMRMWRPPLNLIGVKTPWRGEVKAARASMVEASKQWARDRGLVG
jgi:hypothetical protein